MTYAEVKNQFTTVESIDTRLDEIKTLTEEYMKKRDELNDKHFDLIKKFISDNINTSYELRTLTPTNMKLWKDEDTFNSVELWFGYDILDWKNPIQTWKFEMSVASCGNFSVNNTDEKSNRVFEYYNTIASILSNVEFRTNLENLVKNYVDESEELRKDYRKLNSEEQQLKILKKNLEKDAITLGYYEEAKNAEDKTQIVIINKKADPSECKATHRGTPITFHSSPMSKETYDEACKKCRKMNKNDNGAKYIATEIRFIKF